MREVSTALMAYETSVNKASAGATSPAYAVAEKLRPHLANLMGAGGFRALLSRALVLAREEVSWMSEVKVSAAGVLEGLETDHLDLGHPDFLEGSGILVAQLLGLLVAFIGMTLMLRQIEEVWPEFSMTVPVFVGDEVQSEKAK